MEIWYKGTKGIVVSGPKGHKEASLDGIDMEERSCQRAVIAQL